MRTLLFLVLIFPSLGLSGICKKWIALCEGYSSGSLYPAAFRAKGFCIAHVAVRNNAHPYLATSFRPQDYDLKLSIEDLGQDVVLERLREISPEAVLPGAETGVVAANELARDLGLPFNGGDNILALVDKYLFMKLLEKAEIDHIPGILSRDLRGEEMLDWMKENDFTFPMIVKPRASAGTNGFSLISSLREYKPAFNKVVGQEDFHGRIMDEVFIQPFINKTERAHQKIVTDNGRYIYDHDTWEYMKKTQLGSRIYDTASLLTSDQMKSKSLVEVNRAIDTVIRLLKIQVGTLHVETFADGRIVDFAARAPGFGIPQIVKKLTRRDLIERSVESHVDATAFKTYLENQPNIEANAWVIEMMMPNSTKGVFLGYNMGQLLDNPVLRKDLSTFSFKLGQMVAPTIDFRTPGHLTVEGPTADLYKFHQKLRTLEEKGDAYRVFTSCLGPFED